MIRELNRLQPHQVEGVLRDLNKDEAEQGWLNNKMCKVRMRSWLYDRRMGSVTGNPKTGKKRRYAA